MRILGALLLLLAACGAAAAERLHLLIPAGPGGGLDATARALGTALVEADIRTPVSYENMTGGGGGRAMSHFIETAARQQDTLLVNSTPLLVRSLQGLFPHSYHELEPVAGLIADYGVIAVAAASPIQTMAQLVQLLKTNPRSVTVGGGSVRGSLDHIIFALTAHQAGVDPRSVRYLPYDGGGKAMLALLGGEVQVLSSGLGETLGYVRSGDVRVLAVTAAERSRQLPDVPTLTEQGVPVVFANWRGVFAAPGTPPEIVAHAIADMRAAVLTDSWRAALERYGWGEQTLLGADFATYLAQQEAQLAGALTELGFTR